MNSSLTQTQTQARGRCIRVIAMAIATSIIMAAAGSATAQTLRQKSKKWTQAVCDNNDVAAIVRGTSSAGNRRYFIAYVSDDVLRLEKRTEGNLSLLGEFTWNTSLGRSFDNISNLRLLQPLEDENLVVTFIDDNNVYAVRFNTALEYLGHDTVEYGASDFEVMSMPYDGNEYLLGYSVRHGRQHAFVEQQYRHRGSTQDDNLLDTFATGGLGRCEMPVDLHLLTMHFGPLSDGMYRVFSTRGTGDRLKLSLVEAWEYTFDVEDEFQADKTKRARFAGFDLSPGNGNDDEFVCVSRRLDNSLDVGTWCIDDPYNVRRPEIAPLRSNRLTASFAGSYDVGRISNNRIAIAAIDRDTRKAKTMVFHIQSDGWPEKTDTRFTTGPFDMALIGGEGGGTGFATMYRASGGTKEGRLMITSWGF